MPEGLVRIFRELVHGEPYDTASLAELTHMDEVGDTVAASDDNAARDLFEHGTQEFQQASPIKIPDGDVGEERQDQDHGKRYGDQRAGILPAEHRLRVRADHKIVHIEEPADPEPLETAGGDDLFRIDRFPLALRAGLIQQTMVKQFYQLAGCSLGRADRTAGDGERKHRIREREYRDIGIKTKTLEEE